MLLACTEWQAKMACHVHPPQLWPYPIASHCYCCVVTASAPTATKLAAASASHLQYTYIHKHTPARKPTNFAATQMDGRMLSFIVTAAMMMTTTKSRRCLCKECHASKRAGRGRYGHCARLGSKAQGGR